MSMKSRAPFRPLIKEPATEVVGTGELLKKQPTGQARHHRLSETGQARNRSEPVNRSGQAPSIGTDRGNEARKGDLAGQVQATQSHFGQRILTGKGICFPDPP